MPTYEYECQRCGHKFEQFQSMNDPPRQRCPACRGKVKRLMSGGAGIIFRGSGFYQTDYRSEGYRKAESSEKNAAPAKPSDAGGPASSTAGASEAKKEAKKE